MTLFVILKQQIGQLSQIIQKNPCNTNSVKKTTLPKDDPCDPTGDKYGPYFPRDLSVEICITSGFLCLTSFPHCCRFFPVMKIEIIWVPPHFAMLRFLRDDFNCFKIQGSHGNILFQGLLVIGNGEARLGQNAQIFQIFRLFEKKNSGKHYNNVNLGQVFLSPKNKKHIINKQLFGL